MKEIILEQAYFGDKNNGHSCLCKSILNRDLLTFLARITDLPIHKPPSLDVHPYYGVHTYDRWIVFTKTVYDTMAHRSGMVFTHCLIIEIKDVPYLNDLQVVANHFFPEIPNGKKELVCPAIKISQQKEVQISPLPSVKSFAGKVLSNPSNKCWIIKNSTDFLSWYINLWNSLKPTMRSSFTFRLSFSNTDIESDRYLFYLVPPELLRKWDEKCQAETDEVLRIGVGSQWLLKEKEANDFNDFVNQIDCRLEKIQDVELAEKAYDLHCKLPEIKIIQQIQLIRLIEKISGNSEKGKEKKDSILSQIASHLKSSDNPDFIFSTGNLSLTKFPDGEKILAPVLDKAVQELWKSEFVEETIEFIERYQQKSSMQWWTATVTIALQSMFRSFTISLAKFCWRLWLLEIKSLAFCFNFLPNKENSENQLIASLPAETLRVDLLSALQNLCLERQWYLLHAHLLTRHFSFSDSLKKQLKAAPEHSQSLAIITGYYEPLEVIRIAALEESQLIWDIVGSISITWAVFAKEFQVQTTGWRRIGLAKFKKDIPDSKERQYVQAVVYKIFARFIQGEDVEQEWMSAVSQSNFNDLLQFPDRSLIWNLLPLDLKPVYLKATAQSYLRSKSYKSLELPESPLATEILSNERLQEVFKLDDLSINNVCDLLELFPRLEESVLEKNLSVLGLRPIQKLEAARLGRLVAARGWRSVVKRLYLLAKVNNGFRMSLNECVNLLDFIHRIDAKISGMVHEAAVSRVEWWEAFEEVCNRLYYDESDIKRIWNMAGGDVSHLPNQVSARIIWRQIMRELQQMSSSNRLHKLLERIEKEKGGNTELIFLVRSMSFVNI